MTKPFTTISIIIFALVSIAHFVRLSLSLEITVGGLIIPSWLSGISVIISAGLAYMLWRENHILTEPKSKMGT